MTTLRGQGQKGRWDKVAWAVAVSAVYGVLTALVFFCFYSSGTLVGKAAISSATLGERLVQDAVMHLGLPLLLVAGILVRERSVASLGLTLKSPKVVAALGAVYVVLFVLFGEKSLVGVYVWLYYLLSVSFAEEVVFRGYLFQRIFCALNESKKAAVIAGIISGAAWGIMHAIVPAMVDGQSFFAVAFSSIGGGIVAGAVFAYALHRSGSLFVPVFIHAALDYLGTVV